MIKSEKGSTYINWVIIILVALIFAAITIRVWVGENGLSQQRKDEKAMNQTEKNIVIEITDETKY